MLHTLDRVLGRHPALRTWSRHCSDLRQQASGLKQLSDPALLQAADDVRESFARGSEPQSAVTLGLALAVEALNRTLGIELYDVQLMAAWALSFGSVAEMQTGEGKTFSIVPAAVVAVLRGQSVHIATPNAYLAERDFSLLRPAYETLGVSVGLLGDSSTAIALKNAAYDCEITYGTGFEFGFDYLRDQALQQLPARQPLGVTLLDRLRGGVKTGRASIQRGHQMAIVDEVDNVLLDDAGSPLILCDATQGAAEDTEACLVARSLVPKMAHQGHFVIEPTGTICLTDAGTRFIHSPAISIPVKQLRRPWSEYVQQAIKAELILRREVHYIVTGSEIQIVDGSTGRIFPDRTWSDGLHQAIEAKEGLPITNERSVIAQITRQRYYRIYESLAGMTGTATGCEREFRKIYNMQTWRIPRRVACRRKVYPLRAFSSADAKWEAMAGEVVAIHRTGRPILIGTRTILDSEKMAFALSRLKLPHVLLNGRQDAQEADIIRRAGSKGVITIATNLAGRGTDILLSSEIKDSEGLHVIVSEPNELQRVDRQLIGRCARQGDPGSARTFVSAEDALIRMHAPWLERPMRRCADRRGELQLNLASRLWSIQQRVERRQAAARMELMKRDLARESLLSQMDDVS